MVVTLVSECEERALVETRRILDQFAERRGQRCWQTVITQQGLETLHRLLRRSARKNTAVACHRNRGRSGSELLWVVGDRRRFNHQGAVPTNRSQRLYLQRQHRWRHARWLVLLADLAGLWHDVGKAQRHFQQRLRGEKRDRNWLRHEWVSLRLWQAFVQFSPSGETANSTSDLPWLQRLQQKDLPVWPQLKESLILDGLVSKADSPFQALTSPIARTVGYLILTHHRLPIHPKPGESLQVSQLDEVLVTLNPAWNESHFQDEQSQISEEEKRSYWRLPDQSQMPLYQPAWQQRASRVAHNLLQLLCAHEQEDVQSLQADPFLLHLSRLSLMLADHRYSSLPAQSSKPHPKESLFANSCQQNGKTEGKQLLGDHLLGVARQAASVAHFLPTLAASLPALAHSRALQRHTTNPEFAWQNHAADLALSVAEQANSQGGFVVNMASTGTGKTLANARILYALSPQQQGFRCSFALGLRVLTLQTGRVLREQLQLSDHQLALRVGDAATLQLLNSTAIEREEGSDTQDQMVGSESEEPLLEKGSEVDYSTASTTLLAGSICGQRSTAFLHAPLLACTIDHLIPAVDSLRGGSQILPMLRLLTSDLVLDEVDDFDLPDLPALTRLVHLVGMLGRKVLLSSATLPPALVKGLFAAYHAGRSHYCRHHIGAENASCCLWVDEEQQRAHTISDSETFNENHRDFAAQRAARLAEATRKHPRRRASLLALPPSLPTDPDQLSQSIALRVIEQAITLHQHHHSELQGKRVSFGLIRLANIAPLYRLAWQICHQTLPPPYQMHLCVYHSQHPLLVRSAIEKQLDAALDRRPASKTPPQVLEQLQGPRPDHLFIVLGSPVTEVGRDHDYDWAIVEPSSMRSLIQLAGRVRRHRQQPVDRDNILIFDYNLRHFSNTQQPCFRYPGYEDHEHYLNEHHLPAILDAEEYRFLDSCPRIEVSSSDFVQLEHRQIGRRFAAPPEAPKSRGGRWQPAFVNASSCWRSAVDGAQLTGLLPQFQPFRPPTPGRIEGQYRLLPDNENSKPKLYQRHYQRMRHTDIPVDEMSCHHLQIDPADGISFWPTLPYLDHLRQLAQRLGCPRLRCAQRFGGVSLSHPPDEPRWSYHFALGFGPPDLH